MNLPARSFMIASAACGLAASAGIAQYSPSGVTPPPPGATAPAQKGGMVMSGNPARDNLNRMTRSVTIDLNETRLEDVMKFLVEVTGAEIEPLWKTDTESEGLDKESLVTLSVKDLPALTFLDKVFEKLEGGTETHSWQMTDYGAVQIGTKERLNKFKRIEIYDINDLLFVLPIYNNAPTIDLSQVLQQSKGGSGGSPFKDDNANKPQAKPKEERAQEIKQLITDLVENAQWLDNGGTGGTIKYWQGNFIINAPDYMQRQVNGYRWWPSYKASTTPQGRRYVTLNLDTSNSTVDVPLRTLPVTAVAGGSSGAPSR